MNFDALYKLTGFDDSLWNLVFLDFRNRRVAQKREYGGEFFLQLRKRIDEGERFLTFPDATRNELRKRYRDRESGKQ